MNEWMMIMPVFAVKAWLIVTIIVIIALVAGLVALSIYGKKLQTRQEESQKQLQAAAQNASFLVIDKKKMKLKESGLPQLVMTRHRSVFVDRRCRSSRQRLEIRLCL